MKKNLISKKALIKKLLRDHLVSYRLTQGLDALGLDMSNYDLYVGEIVFSLMGFGDSAEEEKLFEEFLNWSQRVLTIDFSESTRVTALNELRDDIYWRLKRESKLRKIEESK